MSTRRDIFGESICLGLGRLQGAGKDHGWNWTRKIIQEEWKGRNVGMVINENTEVVGSGCVAQVYKCRKDDGSYAAVKIIHPNIKSSIYLDLLVLEDFAGGFDRMPEWTGVQYFALPEAVREFKGIMEGQIDMKKEADNLKRFREQFKDHSKSVVFPKPDDSLTTHNILVEAYESGSPISSHFGSSSSEKKALARPLITAFLRMVFTHSFIHCDLHPGNVLVKDDGRLVILDAGIVSELEEGDKKNLRDLFRAVVFNKGEEAGRMIVDRAKRERCEDKEMFAREIGKIVSEFHEQRSIGLTLGAVKIGSLLSRVLDLCRTHRVLLEPAMANVVLSTIVLEGVGRTLDPDLNLFKAAMPFLVGV